MDNAVNKVEQARIEAKKEQDIFLGIHEETEHDTMMDKDAELEEETEVKEVAEGVIEKSDL